MTRAEMRAEMGCRLARGRAVVTCIPTTVVAKRRGPDYPRAGERKLGAG